MWFYQFYLKAASPGPSSAPPSTRPKMKESFKTPQNIFMCECDNVEDPTSLEFPTYTHKVCEIFPGSIPEPPGEYACWTNPLAPTNTPGPMEYRQDS